MKKEFLVIGICVLICAILIALLMVFSAVSRPTKAVKDCNDGWSTQTEGDNVYRTYIPKDDTCKK